MRLLRVAGKGFASFWRLLAAVCIASPWLTMLTCAGYDEHMQTYRWRVVVHAAWSSVAEDPLGED